MSLKSWKSLAVAGMLLALLGTSAQAGGVFVTGTMNVNSSDVGFLPYPGNYQGFQSVDFLTGAGTNSYTNAWTAGNSNPNIPAAGDKVTSVGVLGLSNFGKSYSLSGGAGTSMAYLTSGQFVAVYALQGVLSSNTSLANFDPSVGGKGVIEIISLTNPSTFNPSNPNTWLAGTVVGTLTITGRPSSSIPGSAFTHGAETDFADNIGLLNGSGVNTASAAISGGALLNPNAQFQFVWQGGSLISGFNGLDQNPDFFVNLTQALTTTTPSNPGDTDLNSIFDTLMGLPSTTDGFAVPGGGGNDYDPTPLITNGDAEELNQGGFAVPGAIVPEPASMVLWSVFGAGFALSALRRRFSGRK